MKQALALHHVENVVLPVVASGGAMNDLLTSWRVDALSALTWTLGPLGLLLHCYISPRNN
jgi:hypothetical protein